MCSNKMELRLSKNHNYYLCSNQRNMRETESNLLPCGWIKSLMTHRWMNIQTTTKALSTESSIRNTTNVGSRSILGTGDGSVGEGHGGLECTGNSFWRWGHRHRPLCPRRRHPLCCCRAPPSAPLLSSLPPQPPSIPALQQPFSPALQMLVAKLAPPPPPLSGHGASLQMK
jgi:hypothetical protein